MQPPEQNAVVYARVSSKEQEQGFSIPAQLRLLREYAACRGLSVAHEFVDVETAKATGRTGFSEMLAFLRKNGCRIVLVEKTDRLYRNIKDWVTLDDLHLELHFVKENVVLGPESRSSEKFMHGIKVLMAKNYIDNLSEETRKGMLEKARTGLWPSFAPVGYRNVISSDGKRIIAPDPETAPVIAQLYERFASGVHSLKALAAWARREGTGLRQLPLHKSTLHQILRKRLYCGDFDWDGATYRGTHEPLVAKEVWNRVQELLDGRQHARKRRHDFTYAGLVSCGHCGCAMVGEIKKQRYVYYHCTGYRQKCPEPYTREELLTGQIVERLRELVVPKPITDWLRAALVDSDANEKRARQQALARAHAEHDRLNARIETMYLDKLDGRISAAFYDEKAAAWRSQQAELQRKITDLRTAGSGFKEAIHQIELTSTACARFPLQPPEEQRRLLCLLLDCASWRNGQLETTFRQPFAALRVSNSASFTKDGNNRTERPKIEDWLLR